MESRHTCWGVSNLKYSGVNSLLIHGRIDRHRSHIRRAGFRSFFFFRSLFSFCLCIWAGLAAALVSVCGNTFSISRKIIIVSFVFYLCRDHLPPTICFCRKCEDICRNKLICFIHFSIRHKCSTAAVIQSVSYLSRIGQSSFISLLRIYGSLTSRACCDWHPHHP